MKATNNTERTKELDYRAEMLCAVQEVVSDLKRTIEYHANYAEPATRFYDHELAAKVREDLLTMILEMVLN